MIGNILRILMRSNLRYPNLNCSSIILAMKFESVLLNFVLSKYLTWSLQGYDSIPAEVPDPEATKVSL